MRLVRELLVADAEPGLATAGTRDRARRYLDVVVAGLGLRGAALVVREQADKGLECAASTLPAAANVLLTDLTGGSPLVLGPAPTPRLPGAPGTGDSLVRAVRD